MVQTHRQTSWWILFYSCVVHVPTPQRVGWPPPSSQLRHSPAGVFSGPMHPRVPIVFFVSAPLLYSGRRHKYRWLYTVWSSKKRGCVLASVGAWSQRGFTDEREKSPQEEFLLKWNKLYRINSYDKLQLLLALLQYTLWANTKHIMRKGKSSLQRSMTRAGNWLNVWYDLLVNDINNHSYTALQL